MAFPDRSEGVLDQVYMPGNRDVLFESRQENAILEGVRYTTNPHELRRFGDSSSGVFGAAKHSFIPGTYKVKLYRERTEEDDRRLEEFEMLLDLHRNPFRVLNGDD